MPGFLRLLLFLLGSLFPGLVACSRVEWLQLPTLTQNARRSRSHALRALRQDGNARPTAVARVL